MKNYKSSEAYINNVSEEELIEILKKKLEPTLCVSIELNTSFSLNKREDVYCRIDYGDWVEYHGYNTHEFLKEEDWKRLAEKASWKTIFQNKKETEEVLRMQEHLSKLL